MNRIKLTENIFLDEYIPQKLYKQYALKPHILIGLLDRRLIESDQKLRDEFGPVTINNWWTGGNRNWSGLRTPDSSYFSPTSQHSFGRASDKIFTHVSPDKVRNYIKANWEELGITCIEGNVNWLHSDVRFWQTNDLLIVYP